MMNDWKEKVIKFNEKKDLESMLTVGRRIEDSLPRIRYVTEQQFQKDIHQRNEYVYRELLKEYKR